MMNLEDTLLAFSEWLDGQGIIAPPEDFEGGDDRTHADLAAQFIEQWDGASLPGLGV